MVKRPLKRKIKMKKKKEKKKEMGNGKEILIRVLRNKINDFFFPRHG